MSEPAPAHLSDVFHALADVHRRRILQELEHRPRSVGELASPLPISLAAASKHVQVLERAGLVRKAVEGRRRVCHLQGAPLREAYGWLARYERFWSDRLDDLERALRAERPTEGHDHA